MTAAPFNPGHVLSLYVLLLQPSSSLCQERRRRALRQTRQLLSVVNIWVASSLCGHGQVQGEQCSTASRREKDVRGHANPLTLLC